MHERILIIGTGLIGASIGLALKSLSPELFSGTVLGCDTNPDELATAFRVGAIDGALSSPDAVLAVDTADIYVLATPVLPILDWIERLAPILGPHQLVTDAGSTKLAIAKLAEKLFNTTGEANPDRARFLPGHPMAGKELGGAALADANLFDGAAWLFTPLSQTNETTIEERWRALVAGMGAVAWDLDPAQHDELCAWISHLPQMLATALASLLQDTFPSLPQPSALQSATLFQSALDASDSGNAEKHHALENPHTPTASTALTTTAVHALAGRALREMTRLGASPYSMWRDVALTNTDPIAAALHALEQRLAHIRENLRTPELRQEFTTANRFRTKQQ